MVRKATPSKSAANKAGARKHAPKTGARASSPSAKAATRKGQSAKIQTKRVVKMASAKVNQAKKAPVKKAPVAAKAPVALKAPASVKPPVAKALAKAPAATRIVAPQAAGGQAAAAQSGGPQGGDRSRSSGGSPRRRAQDAGSHAQARRPGDHRRGCGPQIAVDKVALARQQAAAANKKPVHQRHGFKTNEWIVYPAHGVGRIVGIEEQEIAGMSLELFVITFEKDKMTLRVPTGKSASVGMRKLAEEGVVKRAMETLKGRARIKRTMWSRRAQEYEAKINSGDLIAIAEVVRDLYRSESQPEQSYSERQLYEAALDRMAREIAAVDKLDERGAVQRITEVLSKSAKGRRLAAEEAEVKAA